ncbi:unnamed protein product [Allacma fusca]|uniref:DUF4806 domain-containing protein n=1 Tax=Allacma fusca TaxID=39272 RepID=A0A8J2P2P8_9HEXA|nr:unnamed protein product [Allacma fusca]
MKRAAPNQESPNRNIGPPFPASLPSKPLQAPFGIHNPNVVATTTTVTSPQVFTENRSTDLTSFEKMVLAGISVIKVRLSTIEETQTMILQQLNTINGTVEKSSRPHRTVKLPVESLAELRELDSKISASPDTYTELVKAFEWLITSDIRESTYTILRKLMVDVVAQNLNWKGRHGKTPFGQFELSTLITETVNFRFGTKNGNEKLIQKATKNWLKAAKNRMKPTSLRPVATASYISDPSAVGADSDSDTDSN